MGRKILAVVVALIVATAIFMIVEMLNSFVLPPPPTDVLADPAKLREYMANGPAKAYIVVLVGYVIGSFVSGFIVTKMSRQVSADLTLPLIVGGLLTLAGVSNFIMLPGQPIWFAVLALLTFIPMVLIGNRFAR
ncbi:MAG: hypothetical protein ABJA02_10850 [Acidobacteriota bacterium]